MPRSRRQVTSHSSRPSTVADDYAFSPPATASSFTSDNPQPLPAALHPHAHYHQFYTDDRSTLDGVTEEEEEDDESDAEDVFAYLPPTTADVERERSQEQQQPQHQYAHLQPPSSPQSASVSSPVAAVYQSAESPPETTSSYDFIPNGAETLRMQTMNYSRPSRESIPPYHASPNIPSPMLDVKTGHLSSSLAPQSLTVPVPAPTPGPSQSPAVSTSYFPGTAFDNPYQLALSQYTNARARHRSHHAPSTEGSGYTNSTTHHNINVSALSRNAHGRSARDDCDRDTITTVEDGSMSKFPSEVNTIDVISSGLERGSADWGVQDGSVKTEYDFDPAEEEDSPYPEVRASVSNIDDTEIPALTLRMWIIGLLLCVIGSGMNVFFNFRNPAPAVIPLILLLLSYPLGKVAAYVLPIKTYRISFPTRLGGTLEIDLNPGPWNIKEHVLLYIMANGEFSQQFSSLSADKFKFPTVSLNAPFALSAIVVGEMYYNIKLGYGFSLCLILATQLTGFGLAGLTRRILVYPASMVWPANLVICALLNTLHAEEDDLSGGISRYRYYVYSTLAAFVWFFFPGYLFMALSVFSWVCWIKPNNVIINQLFGVRSGLGMGLLTFDWTQISWVTSPLTMPWWATVHVFIGFVAFFWIVTPLLYYTNVWNLSYFPIASSLPYDRFGNIYNISRVLTPDHRLNVTAYDAYSPLYLPATYAMAYVLALALFTCVITHTVLYHGRNIWYGMRRIKTEPDDIHAKLMSVYPEVPDWWYLSVFVSFFLVAIILVEVWHTSVPVWGLALALVLPVLYIIPSGFLFAMTAQTITLNLPAQLVPGLLLPGNPLANMVFKSYSVQTLNEGISFIQDLKLGHYMKIPPRSTFLVQIVGTLVVAFVQVGVKEWMFSSIPDICSPNQKSDLTCPRNQVFFTASAVWGLIGPRRQFGHNSIYHAQLWALLIGAFLPIPFYIWQRRYPGTRLKYINTPLIITGVQFIPPATGINYSSWFALGFVFQYVLRRYRFAWWSKFNYVTSAALDSGTAISLLVIFFTLQFPKNGINLNWWGNTVYTRTADFAATPLRQVPPGGLIPPGGLTHQGS